MLECGYNTNTHVEKSTSLNRQDPNFESMNSRLSHTLKKPMFSLDESQANRSLYGTNEQKPTSGACNIKQSQFYKSKLFRPGQGADASMYVPYTNYTKGASMGTKSKEWNKDDNTLSIKQQ